MAMKKAMTLDLARAIAQRIAVGRAKYGPQYSPPYSMHDMTELVSVLESAGNWEGPSKQDMTRLARQLTACKAREARGKGKDSAPPSAGMIDDVENS